MSEEQGKYGEQLAARHVAQDEFLEPFAALRKHVSDYKPNDRTALDRQFAVLATEAEKLFALALYVQGQAVQARGDSGLVG